MAFILAQKVCMTQQFRDDEVVPVTVLEASPCAITQVRTPECDGYAAVQVGAGRRRAVTKPLAGHLKDLGPLRWLREFRIDSRQPTAPTLGPGQADSRKPDGSEWSVGDRMDVTPFKPGDVVQVSGVSKGKGFQGVMKRHRFHGQDATHGTKDQHRMPGSISGGGRNGKGRVRKGMRMAGRMGGDRVTVQGLEVIAVDAERHQLLVRGAVPGARGALLEVRTYDGHWVRRRPVSNNVKSQM